MILTYRDCAKRAPRWQTLPLIGTPPAEKGVVDLNPARVGEIRDDGAKWAAGWDDVSPSAPAKDLMIDSQSATEIGAGIDHSESP